MSWFRPVLLVCVGVFCGACEGQTERLVERTEPWLREEVALSSNVQNSVTFRPEAGQVLEFEVKGSGYLLRGRVPVSGGAIQIQPTALERVRGELTFDLARLSIDSTDEAASDGGTDGTRSLAALRWLGLGEQVAGRERDRFGRAQFRLSLARQLSERAAHRGQVVKARRGNGDWVRRIRATVDGDLTLRGVQVTHVLTTELDFFYVVRPSASEVPVAIEVKLGQPDALPLVEHDILPRDERGDLLASEPSGKGVGPVARISGRLRLVR